MEEHDGLWCHRWDGTFHICNVWCDSHISQAMMLQTILRRSTQLLQMEDVVSIAALAPSIPPLCSSILELISSALQPPSTITLKFLVIWIPFSNWEIRMGIGIARIAAGLAQRPWIQHAIADIQKLLESADLHCPICRLGGGAGAAYYWCQFFLGIISDPMDHKYSDNYYIVYS